MNESEVRAVIASDAVAVPLLLGRAGCIIWHRPIVSISFLAPFLSTLMSRVLATLNLRLYSSADFPISSPMKDLCKPARVDIENEIIFKKMLTG